MVDPERNGKRHLSWRQSVVVMLLALAIAFAPWLAAIPYR
jgi:hypothetical protein